MPELFILRVGVGLGFGLVNSTVDVIWWGVDRVQLEINVAGVANVVLRTGGNDQDISFNDGLNSAIQIRFCRPTYKHEGLLDMGVDFHADFATNRNTHEHELAFGAGVDDRPKGVVGQRILKDIGVIWSGHRDSCSAPQTERFVHSVSREAGAEQRLDEFFWGEYTDAIIPLFSQLHFYPSDTGRCRDAKDCHRTHGMSAGKRGLFILRARKEMPRKTYLPPRREKERLPALL